MPLNDKDLFLVTQEDAQGYVDKNVTFKKLKRDLGIRLAVEETSTPAGGVVDGIPGLMYPDASFSYDRTSGRLSIPLDARGVTFIGLIDSSNKDVLPTGNEQSGDFYICDEADLEVSTSVWLGIDSDGTGVTADPAAQVITETGAGYFPNNGVVTATSLKAGVNPAQDVGIINVTIENGRVIFVQHEATTLDIPALGLEGGFFELSVNNNFAYNEPALLEVLSVVTTGNEHVINFNIISQGNGFRSKSGGGSLTGARAVPVGGDGSKAFNVDVTIDGTGAVASLDALYLQPGHSDGDELEIQVPYNTAATLAATFTLALDGEAAVVIQINDKLIKKADGEWAILTDQLANQAVLTITNEEDANGDLTPALKIKKEGGDPRYITIAIDEVDSINPGLMPPDLYDQINALPDKIAGGTVVDVLTDEEDGIDLLSDGSTHTGLDVNPIQVQEDRIEDDDGNLLPIDLAKTVTVSVNPTDILDLGGEFTRVRGTVFIANEAELETAFARNDTGMYVYDRVVNAALAGDTLMPRNLKHLDERDEDYKTAKRVRLSTTKYEVESGNTFYADVTATLTYEDGTEVADNTTYAYQWIGTEYLTNITRIVGDGTSVLRVYGDDFAGPTNIVCSVTETTDVEFQTLEDSIYLHFSDASINPPPPAPPLIGQVAIIGENPVKEGDTKDYYVQITGGTTLVNTTTLEIDPNSAVSGQITLKDADTDTYEVIFDEIGTLTLKATVTSPGASDDPVVTTRDIEVFERTYIGNVSIVGPSPVEHEDTEIYNVEVTGGNSVNDTIVLEVNPNSQSQAIITVDNPDTNSYAVEFTEEGEVTLTATVTNAQAENSPQIESTFITVNQKPDVNIGNVAIDGPDPVMVGDLDNYQVVITDGTTDDNVVTLVIDDGNSTATGAIVLKDGNNYIYEVEFFTEGVLRLAATVTSQAANSSVTVSRDINVDEVDVFIGDVSIDGSDSANIGDTEDYQVVITNGTTVDNVVDLVIDDSSVATGTITLKDADTHTYEVTFDTDGVLTLSATVTSATGEDSPQTATKNVNVLDPSTTPDVEPVGEWDWIPRDTFANDLCSNVGKARVIGGNFMAFSKTDRNGKNVVSLINPYVGASGEGKPAAGLWYKIGDDAAFRPGSEPFRNLYSSDCEYDMKNGSMPFTAYYNVTSILRIYTENPN